MGKFSCVLLFPIHDHQKTPYIPIDELPPFWSRKSIFSRYAKVFCFEIKSNLLQQWVQIQKPYQWQRGKFFPQLHRLDHQTIGSAKVISGSLGHQVKTFQVLVFLGLYSSNQAIMTHHKCPIKDSTDRDRFFPSSGEKPQTEPRKAYLPGFSGPSLQVFVFLG